MYTLLVLFCIFVTSTLMAMDTPVQELRFVEQVKQGQAAFELAQKNYKQANIDAMTLSGPPSTEEAEKLKAVRNNFLAAFELFFPASKTAFEKINSDEVTNEDLQQIAAILQEPISTKQQLAQKLYECSNNIAFDKVGHIQGLLYPNSTTFQSSLPRNYFSNLKRLRTLYDQTDWPNDDEQFTPTEKTGSTVSAVTSMPSTDSASSRVIISRQEAPLSGQRSFWHRVLSFNWLKK